MAICAPNMKKCDPKKKCLSGPNEGMAYNPSNPCCGQGEFNAETCDCENKSGVYEYRSELMTPELSTDGKLVLYWYVQVADPFFNPEGKLLTPSLSAGSLATTTDGGTFCVSSCAADGVIASYPCATDLPGPYICTNSGSDLDCFGCGAPDSFTCNLTFSEWYAAPVVTREACPAVCSRNPDYFVPTENAMEADMALVVRDENYVRQPEYEGGQLARPRSNVIRCDGSTPRKIVFEDSLAYIGPGDIRDYFPDQIISNNRFSSYTQVTPAI